MILKSIELINYRIYRGVNKISFDNDNDRNVFLIFGENGFGKSTFLQSLLWCMYGRLIIEIDDNYRKEVQNSGGGYNNMQINNLNDYCRQILNIEATPDIKSSIKRKGYSKDTDYLKKWSIYSVSIEFSDIYIPSIPCRSLIISRSYDIIREEENVEILIDGVKNELSSEIGHEIFINDFILNKDVARFFFFDSEKIVSLAETNTLDDKRRLGSAYNEVLGVKKYEVLKKNLENLRIRLRKKSDDNENRVKLSLLLNKQQSLAESVAENDKETNHLSEDLLVLRKENEDLQIQLMREGNVITIKELKDEENIILVSKRRDEEYKRKIKAFLDFAPFAIAGNLLQRTKDQIEKDFNSIKSHNDIQNQKILLSNISRDLLEIINLLPIDHSNKNEISKSVRQVISKYQSQVSEKETLLNVNKEMFDEISSLYNYLTTSYKVEFQNLADDYRKNRQILKNSIRKVTNMQKNENDVLIKEIRNRKNKLEKKISEIEHYIRQLHEKRGGLNKDMAVVSRQISELSKKVSLDDNDALKDEVVKELISKLNTFLVSLKSEKKNLLERRIKDTMNMFMHKSDFISEVEVSIIEDIIDINLISNDGSIIKKEFLSKGEQQLFATSLLKTLVEESGIQFPVFIDSPLQKFDKSHSNKIITEFYPTVSKQVILFPLLHKELTLKELEIMKPFVNSVFILKNKNSQSFIQSVDINDLLKE